MVGLFLLHSPRGKTAGSNEWILLNAKDNIVHYKCSLKTVKNTKNLLPAVDLINWMLIVAFRAYFCSGRSVIASPETTEHLQATGLFWFTICEMFLITWNKVGSLTHSGTSNKGDRDLFFCFFFSH